MLEAFREKRKRAAQVWEETRERGAPESQALIAFEKALAEARQSYELAVTEAWQLSKGFMRPVESPAGYQDARTRRNTIAQAWQSYQETTRSALESFRREAGSNGRYEQALYLLCEERVTLGG